MEIALTYPDAYAGCISLLGSLDITCKNRPINPDAWKTIFDFNMVSPDELVGTEHDLYAPGKKNFENEIGFPEMYIWCETEETRIFLNPIRIFMRFLRK